MAENRNVALNVKVLEDREVLFHFGDNPTIDRETGAFMKGWHSGGVEPNDSAWSLNREVNTNTTNMSGGQSVTSYQAGAVTSTVDLIPGSPVLDHIEWPDTAETNGVLYRKHSNRVAKAFIARVHKFQSGVVGIMVSREKAGLTVAERSVGTDPSGRTVNAAWQNGEDEYIMEEMYYLVREDGTVERVEEKIFKQVEDVNGKLASGEAFVPKGSASGLAKHTVKKDGESPLREFVDPETGEVAEVEEGASRTDGDGSEDVS
nr:MAG TPA: major tail protein [Caudoviricetes sp.]